MQTHLALLTPVPVEHLHSGLEVCTREGRVAYGSNSGLCLAGLRHDLEGEECDVLFFASHEGVSGPAKVTWWEDSEDCASLAMAGTPNMDVFARPLRITTGRGLFSTK